MHFFTSLKTAFNFISLEGAHVRPKLFLTLSALYTQISQLKVLACRIYGFKLCVRAKLVGGKSVIKMSQAQIFCHKFRKFFRGVALQLTPAITSGHQRFSGLYHYTSQISNNRAVINNWLIPLILLEMHPNPKFQ